MTGIASGGIPGDRGCCGVEICGDGVGCDCCFGVAGCVPCVVGPLVCGLPIGVLGAPDAGCGSGEFVCGHAKAADNSDREMIANGEPFIANQLGC